MASSLEVVSRNPLTTVLAEPSPTAALPRVSAPHVLAMHKICPLSQSKKEVEALARSVSRALKEWHEIAYNRLGDLRAEAQTTPSLLDAVQLDRSLCDSAYKTLKIEIQNSLETAKKCSSTAERILFTTDSEQRIQGVLVAYEEMLGSEKTLYIKALLSPPWNVAFHSKISPEHQALRVRHAGLALLREAYHVAQQIGATSVTLRPLSNSFTFYQERVGLQWIANEQPEPSYFKLPVLPNAVPKTLDPSPTIIHRSEEDVRQPSQAPRK